MTEVTWERVAGKGDLDGILWEFAWSPDRGAVGLFGVAEDVR